MKLVFDIHICETTERREGRRGWRNGGRVEVFVPRIESEQARVPFGITLSVVKLVEGAKSESLKNACPFLCDLTNQHQISSIQTIIGAKASLNEINVCHLCVTY